jgi:hypothetical protein
MRRFMKTVTSLPVFMEGTLLHGDPQLGSFGARRRR